MVAPDPEVDVRAHVHEMSRALGQVLEPIGGGHPQFRTHFLDGVNQVMVGTRMGGLAPQHRLEHSQKLGRSPARLVVVRPIVPGRRVHQ